MTAPSGAPPRRPAARGALGSTRRLAAIAGFALATLSAVAPARAVSDPELDWWTYETAHFRVHYPRHLEPVAARVAALAESVRGRVSHALGHAPRDLTEIVLTDDTDSANGSATSLPYNVIRLFVTAPDDLSPLGDYDDWMLDLVTHEYAHIAHTDNISGVPRVINAILGKTISPNQAQPRWLVEGLAVVAESEHSSAGRMRSSLFDMYLRADVLDDRLASIDQFSSNAYRWPQGNLWYLYGSRFLGWIGEVYGKDTLRAVSADYGASVVPWGINRAIRRVTGRTYVELYESFTEHLRRLYGAQMREVEKRGLREGVRIDARGRLASYARFVPPSATSEPGAHEVVYFRDDANERPGLYRVRIDRRPGGDPPREVLLARTNGASTPAFTPEGDLVFNSVAPFRNLYYRDDLFRIPRGERAPRGDEAHRVRLSEGLRTASVDVSPDGKHVVFPVNAAGTTYLEIADLEPDRVTNRRALVPSGRFEQAYTPRFSPDGRRVAYSAWTAGGYRDIRIVDVATGRVEAITRDRALDVQPAWSHDGRTLYFSSDRTGIYNVYAYDLATRSLAQVTNVRTGAFAPAPSHDGRTLVYVGYTSEGYDLYAMPLDRERFLPAPPPPPDRPDMPAEPPPTPMRKAKYDPFPTIGPRRVDFEYAPGNFGGNALTLIGRGSDVVGMHAFEARIVVDTLAPAPAFSFDYRFGRLPVDLTARFAHDVVPRSGAYRWNDRRDPYVEHQNAVTTGISLPFAHEFAGSTLALSYTALHFQGDLPVGRNIDPYATTTIDPPGGIVSLVHLGYALSTVEGVLDTPGTGRGMAIGLGVDLAERATGSDFTLRAFEVSFAGYVPMPWPGRHTLALRAAGAMAAGQYTRRGIYYVGGYDLEQNGFLDTLTSGVFDGAFALRGYPPLVYAGRQYLLTTAEYRFPVVKADRGLATLPVYLRRIDASAFVDYGGAFDAFDPKKLRLFHEGALLHSKQLHTSVGGELWFGITLGYQANAQLRLGYAYGFSAEAIPGGQLFFIAASSF